MVETINFEEGYKLTQKMLRNKIYKYDFLLNITTIEDLIQDCMETFIVRDTFNKYDPQYKKTTYIGRCVMNFIYDTLKLHFANKRDISNSSIVDDRDLIIEDISSTIDINFSFSVSDLLCIIKDPRRNEIFKLLLLGYKTNDICKKYNLSSQRVNTLIREVKQEIKNYIKEES